MRILIFLLTFFSLQALGASSLNLVPDGYPVFSRNKDLDTHNLSPDVNAFNFTSSGNGTTTFNWKIPNHEYLAEIGGFFTGQTAGDYIQVNVVDVDNILGFGANTILSTPVTKYWVNPTANQLQTIAVGYPVFMLQNLYIQILYTSSNILSSVSVHVNVAANRVFL